MDQARRSTVSDLADVRASHAGDHHHRQSVLGEGVPRASHASGGGSHRPSVFGDATLASAHSRLSHMGGPRQSTAHGGHHGGHAGHRLSEAHEEEPPAELTPEQLEVRRGQLGWVAPPPRHCCRCCCCMLI